MIPGRTLHLFAVHICSDKTLERVVQPAIADLQKEYAGAGSASRRVWALLAGYVAILKVMALCAVSVSGTSPDDWGAIVRTMMWSLALIVAVSGLLMLPPLAQFPEVRLSSLFLVALIPQAVPLAIPIGFTFGIAFGLAGRAVTRDMVKVVLLVGCVASIASFVTLAWVMPSANQAYRESVAQALGHSGQLMKSASEMTLSELDREAAIATAVRNPRRADDYAWSFHLRFALSAASVVLAAFLFATAGRGAALRGLLAFAVCVGYWALIYIGQGFAVYSPLAPTVARTVPPFIGAWLPNIVIGAFAIFVASSRSSRLRGSLDPAP
jgi:Lipopolysaccharide export system permease LptF/LptG